MRLPSYTRTSDAERVVKKDGRLFNHARQAGLGWEACYAYFFKHGTLRTNSVKEVQLRGGGLRVLGGKK